ncbi:alcohol dehydrogenase, partial [Acetobacter tropicalis]
GAHESFLPLGSFSLHKTRGNSPMLEDLARAWTASGLRPVIDSVFPFARAREAFDHLMTGSHVGKIVIALSD